MDAPFGDPSDASETPAPVIWKDIYRRVARFKGFQHTEDEKDRVEPSLRTRATRIRKLLSDGKQEEVVKHWEVVKKEVSIDSDIVRDGPEPLFDLPELADLPPNSYLQQVMGLIQPKDSTSTTSTSEEAHS